MMGVRHFLLYRAKGASAKGGVLVSLLLVAFGSILTTLQMTSHRITGSSHVAYTSQSLLSATNLFSVFTRRARHKARAGVFTSYYITPGGGERYLFSIIRAFQDMDYDVDLITEDENICRTKAQVLRVAEELSVGLDPDRLNYIILRNPPSTITTLGLHYDVFFSMFNLKNPEVPGIGKFNMFMCQFPFDGDTDPPHGKAEFLPTYQLVLLNSEFSLHWYSQYIMATLRGLRSQHAPVPTLQVLHPAVDPLLGDKDVISPPSDRWSIVVLGRIFEGRQSKGHELATQLFKQVQAGVQQWGLQGKLKLVLMGNPMPGQEKYVERLRKRADGVSIELVAGASRSQVAAALSKARVYWQLTGLEVDEDSDPASIEHFGIATVEVMSSGVIPVAPAKGGSVTMVHHNETGLLASSAVEVVQHTVSLFDPKNAEHTQQMQRSAREAAALYSTAVFNHRVATFVTRGMLSAGFRQFTADHLRDLRQLPLILPMESDRVALIVEPYIRTEFEYVVRSTMHRLGPRWSLLIVHSRSNAAFVGHALRNVRNVRLLSVDMDFSTVGGYNRLLKAPWFWRTLQAKWCLIFQSDSIILGAGRDIEDFMDYDYVGAPWHEENEIWSSRHAEVVKRSAGVGNGGFSLRRVAPMLDIAEELSKSQDLESENEDITFVKKLIEKGYSIAPRDVAYRFAREVPCKDLEDDVPYALHAAWYYDSGTLGLMEKYAL